MNRLCLVLLATASAALGSSVTTYVECEFPSGCTTRTFVNSFGPTDTLEGFVPGWTPVSSILGNIERSRTLTNTTTFYTDGPPRPGYLDLTFFCFVDGARTGGYFPSIEITGLYYMYCPESSRDNHVSIPIELGEVIEVVILARSLSAWIYGDMNDISSYYYGSGDIGYSLRIHDSASGDPVLMYSTPEPRAQGLIGLLLLCAAPALKHLRRRQSRL
jgi:hypothetical protein